MQDLSVSLPDGRKIAGAGFGPETGRPVLFIAGAATSKLMTFGADLLSEMNVRLLTMDRPGMGASTPDPERTLASTAEDYSAFLASVLGRRVEKVPVIANSQGAVFGLALAVTDRIESLVLVSPADELAHPPIREMLPPEATVLPDLVVSRPDEAEEILSGFTAQGMEEMVLAGSAPSDVAFYSSEFFLSLYRASLAEGFANDGVGYVRDTMIAMGAWGLELSVISCPVRVIFGAHDRSHSPDQGVTLAKRIPGAIRTVYPDGGGAVLWTHAREILSTVFHGEVR